MNEYKTVAQYIIHLTKYSSIQMSIYHVHVNSSINKSFQNALLSSLMEDSDNEEDTCLITGEAFESYPTNERYQLMCGHAFLKRAIYQEVRKQKYDWKHSRHTQPYTIHFYKKLRIHQIMCPYCRTVHKHLLPQWNGYDKLTGVNSPLKYVAMENKCEHILASGKRKGSMCGVYCNDEYCKRHMKLHNQKGENGVNGVNEDTKNIIHDLSDTSTAYTIPETPTCSAILKSGKRKGELCNASCSKSMIANNKQQWVCGRHCKPGTIF